MSFLLLKEEELDLRFGDQYSLMLCQKAEDDSWLRVVAMPSASGIMPLAIR